MPPLGGDIRLGKDLEGIALPLVLRDRPDPSLLIGKRRNPGKQPGLRKLSCFRMKRHGVIRSVGQQSSLSKPDDLLSPRSLKAYSLVPAALGCRVTSL